MVDISFFYPYAIAALIIAMLPLGGAIVSLSRRTKNLSGRVDALSADLQQVDLELHDARGVAARHTALQQRHNALQQSVAGLQKYVTEQKRTDNRPPRGSHASGVAPDTNPITGTGRHTRLGNR